MSGVARIVEILDIVSHGYAQFDNGGSRLTARKFGLHSPIVPRLSLRPYLRTLQVLAQDVNCLDSTSGRNSVVYLGDVSAGARELGYVRVTCYKWAHK